MIKELSILIPVLDEKESITSLVDEIKSEFSNSKVNYEIVIVDDFSEEPVDTYLSGKNLKIIRNPHSKGQSYSILVGVSEASYDFLAIMDGDGQNPPKEILKLLNLFNENFNNCDVVSGIRKVRKDNLLRTLYSKIANLIIRFLTKSKCKDLGCALKIFKKDMISELNYNGDIHRILVPLFEYRGYKLVQTEVEHRHREFGKTKYGFSRLTAVIIDSILLYLTKGFTTTARYALGKLSIFFGLISGFLFILSLYQKQMNDVFIHRNPIFLIGITTFFICLQLLVTSFISFFIENK